MFTLTYHVGYCKWLMHRVCESCAGVGWHTHTHHRNDPPDEISPHPYPGSGSMFKIRHTEWITWPKQTYEVSRAGMKHPQGDDPIQQTIWSPNYRLYIQLNWTYLWAGRTTDYLTEGRNMFPEDRSNTMQIHVLDHILPWPTTPQSTWHTADLVAIF